MAGAELTSSVHLKAAAEDILLDHFLVQCVAESTKIYCIDLLRAYWSGASADCVIRDVVAWFPSPCVQQLQAFCAVNYPEQLLSFEEYSADGSTTVLRPGHVPRQ